MKHKRKRAMTKQIHKRFHKAMLEAEQQEDYTKMLDLSIEKWSLVGKARR